MLTTKEQFIEGVIELGRGLNISLAHEDTQGAFELHEYNDGDAKWLRDAYDARGKSKPGFTSFGDIEPK
jgi:hypothetical protein